MLDEHYFLDKNQKLAPKYSGPHLITKLKGNCNIELLLKNGKFAIVHVNRLKPYLSHVNDGQNFSKQGRDCENRSMQKVQHDTIFIDKPENLGQEEDEGGQDEATDPPEPPAQAGPSRDRHITRRVTKEQGLVYNKDEFRFQPQSTSDTVEALTRKVRKKLIQTKTLRKENFIIVEHVFQYEQVKTPIETTYSETGNPPEDIDKLPEYEPLLPPDREIKTEPPDPTSTPNRETSPEFSKQHIVFYPTPNKNVSFNPKVKKQEFHTPNLDPPRKTKKSDPGTSFAKEVFKSTAEALFPKTKAEYLSPDSRPIRGASKTFAEMFPDSPVVVKPEPAGSQPEATPATWKEEDLETRFSSESPDTDKREDT